MLRSRTSLNELVLQFSNNIVSRLCGLVGCFLLLLDGCDLLVVVCVCSEAWRILFILWGKKICKGVRCLCVMVGTVCRVNSGHVLTRGRCDLPLV
jgi:hypothetical protein